MSSSLSYTAYYARNAIKWFAIGVVIYLILYILWVVSEPLRVREEPPPPIVPLFGGLPLPEFPDPDPNVVFSYRLETITGGLPTNFPDRTVVYQNKSDQIGFFSLDGAIKTANAYGFKNNPEPVNPPNYRWKSAGNLPGILEINSVTRDLDMVLNWRIDPQLFISNKTMTPDSVFRTAQSKLRTGSLWDQSFQAGEHSTVFYKVVNNQLLKADSIADADMVQVNLRRARINDLPIVHADPERPPIWLLITRSGEVVEIHYRFYPIGTESSEYPLRSVKSAWEDLIAGKAHIARIGDNVVGGEVVIRDFSLAYYIANDFQPYTQTVFVIKGDNDFIAYVRAAKRSSKDN